MKRLLLIITSLALFTGCTTKTSINVKNTISQKKEIKVHKPKTLEAILKLDTKGHTGLIGDIIVTN